MVACKVGEFSMSVSTLIYRISSDCFERTVSWSKKTLSWRKRQRRQTWPGSALSADKLMQQVLLCVFHRLSVVVSVILVAGSCRPCILICCELPPFISFILLLMSIWICFWFGTGGEAKNGPSEVIHDLTFGYRYHSLVIHVTVLRYLVEGLCRCD